MAWESFGVVGFDLGKPTPPSRSNEDSTQNHVKGIYCCGRI